MDNRSKTRSIKQLDGGVNIEDLMFEAYSTESVETLKELSQATSPLVRSAVINNRRTTPEIRLELAKTDGNFIKSLIIAYYRNNIEWVSNEDREVLECLMQDECPQIRQDAEFVVKKLSKN